MTGAPGPRVPARASAAGRWSDLGVRIVSGLILAGLGVLAVWQGGWCFAAMTVAVYGLMVWELASLGDPPGRAGQRLLIALLAAAGMGAAMAFPAAAPGLLVAPALILLTPRRDAPLIALYAALAMLAAVAFAGFDRQGGRIVVWLVTTVVASDVLGYFAGRLIGGPKLWPAISPKKTWSGTVAGWLGAALVGAGFAAVLGVGWRILAISPVVALAGQAGDILESLIKRRAGVKDASQLIPGHGGVLDRFDALNGAILALWLLQLAVALPEGLAG